MKQIVQFNGSSSPSKSRTSGVTRAPLPVSANDASLPCNCFLNLIWHTLCTSSAKGLITVFSLICGLKLPQTNYKRGGVHALRA